MLLALLLLVLLIIALLAAQGARDPLRRGRAGEARVSRVLRAHRAEVIDDAFLPDGRGGLTQVDHIALCEAGILVVETKTLSGSLFGKARDGNWIQALGRRRYQLQNPLRQKLGHLAAIRTLLPKTPLHALVVLAGTARFPQGLPEGVYGLLAAARGRPRDAFPAQVRALAGEVAGMARDDAARARVEDLRAAADAALAAGDEKRAKPLVGELEQVRRLLATSYVLRVVNRPDERSGVWRIPDVNTQARNYYLIVEAIDSGGQPVKVPVTNEETRRKELTSRFGVRVGERTFNRVANDKRDDGIIQEDIIGRKAPGTLTPTWSIPTTGATITRW